MVQSIGLNQFNQLIEQHKVEQAAWQTAISKINEKIAILQEQAAYKVLQDAKERRDHNSKFGWASEAMNVVNSIIGSSESGANIGTMIGQKAGADIGGGIGGVLGAIQGFSQIGYTGARLDNEIAVLENQYKQAQLATQASGMQINVAEINQQIGVLQRDVAALQLAYAQENLDYLQNKEFNAELWFRLASAVRELSNSYLDAAVELALLMEKAYNFETGRSFRKIRLDYSCNDLSGLLAGDYLLRDIESFEYDRAVHITEKEVPVKHVISLASSRPMQFFEFLNTDTLTFATTLEEFSRAYPGAYNCRIKDVEIIIEGLLPPGGISGTLSNGCGSVVRKPMPEVVNSVLLKHGISDYHDLPDIVRWRVHGAYLDTLKNHEMETMVLSKYSIREDRIVFTPQPEQLGIFENTGVASEWTLHIPRDANNFNLHTIFDVKFVITFTAQHDQQLASLVRKDYLDYRNNNQDSFAVLAAFSARYQFPDEFYQFINSEETEENTVTLEFPLNKYYFPMNEYNFKTKDVSLVFFPYDSLHDYTINAALQNGELVESASTDASKKGIATFPGNNFTDVSPEKSWKVYIAKQDFIDYKISHIHDIWLCINYTSKVRRP